MTDDRLDAALARWRAHDGSHALHDDDARAVVAADVPRALVLELLVAGAAGGSPRDLFSACARLGRMLGDLGASPSFVATTLDGALAALDDEPARAPSTALDPRLAPARASIAEGYAAVRRETEQARARRGWDYPACAVRVAPGVVALTAGYPADADADATGDWAARVALHVSKDGYARAIVAGQGLARAELESALAFVGVVVTSPEHAALEDAKRRGWGAWITGLFRRS